MHAACTEAPCLQVNYRYRHRITTDSSTVLDDLAARRARRRDPAARHARHGPPAHPGRPAAGDVVARPTAPRPAWIRPAARRAGMTRAHAGAPPDRPPTATARDRHSRGSRYDDSYTLDRYLATGGYEGLKAALAQDAGRGRATR